MLENPPSRQVKSVQKAIGLITQLQVLGGATPAQLTEELDLSKSSVHNYLATLEMEGYVVNNNGTYRLGLRFLTHGMAARKMVSLGQSIIREVQSIADELGQPTWWIQEEYGRGYFLNSAIPQESQLMYGNLGKRSYLHTHAPGKAILALSSKEYVEQVTNHHGLPKLTSQTTTTLNSLNQDLKTVREHGYAISDGEAVLGILSVGAGFRDSEGGRHAIGVFDYSRNFAGNRAQNIGEWLVGAVNDLEEQINNGCK